MNNCPVPIEQRPLEEFKQLNSSYFFSQANKTKYQLYKFLFIAWIGAMPIIALILSGSWSLKQNIVALIILTLIASVIMPTLIISRQYLGWSYILKRLESSKIEYEESGWYDGQTWDKPKEWLEKDLLIAKYEVKPILYKLRNIIILILILAINFIYISKSLELI